MNDIENRTDDYELSSDTDKDVFDYGLEKNNMSNKSERKTGNIGIKIYAAIITFVAGALLATCAFLYKDSKNEIKETITNGASDTKEDNKVKEIVRDYMENGKGTIAMLRELFPDNIIVYDSKKYSFIPVAKNADRSEIVNENIVKLDNGELEYKENGKVISHKGIDVSKYQGEIDWSKVAADGVEYAMIRLGYRGYGSGAIVLDETALTNIDNATKAGIKVGVYFFSQAVTEEEAVEEAKFVIDNIKKYNITYPIVFDTEDIPDADTRTESLTSNDITNIAIAFCEKVKEEGYTPAIYANLRWFALSLDMSKLNEYDKWYAYYDSDFYFPYKISMWQYSESGTVDGITGSVDMNISFKDWK